MHFAPYAAPFALRDVTLRRLRGDHDAALACATLLRKEIMRSTPDIPLVRTVIVKLSDAPDDIHHLVERMLFHKLRNRFGPRLTRRLDLDRLHDERRDRRIDALNASGGRAFANSEREQSAVLALCDCAETHARLEDRFLLPFAARFLSEDDWAAAGEALSAYSDFLAALHQRAAPAR